MQQQFIYWAPKHVSLDQVVANLRVMCAACPIYIAQPTAPVDAGSAAQPATVAPTPAANEFLRERSPDTTEADEDTLTWLYDTFLYGKLSCYVLGDGFRIVEAANVTPSPRTKLEILLRITQTRREKYLGLKFLRFPASKVRVLTNLQLKELLDQWKKEYWTWMHQKTADQWHHASNQQWHLIERRAFRTYL